MTCFSLLPTGTHAPQQSKISAGFTMKLVFASLLMFPIKTITYIHIPLPMLWFGVKSCRSTSMEEPDGSLPFYFHEHIPGKVPKSQIRRFHWRMTMKCTIKPLWGGSKFQGVADLDPSSSVTFSRTQFSCLSKTTNKRALQTMVSAEVQFPT